MLTDEEQLPLDLDLGMNDDKKPLTTAASGSEVDAFLKKLAVAPARADAARGRLLFGLDATASRQPTWDRAAHIQSEMFTAAAAVGGLKIQLCFYRGFGEFRVSPWTSQAADLVRMMTSVSCQAGETQIRKVLQYAVNEAQKERLGALVFVGDCVEENIDVLATIAGLAGLQAFDLIYVMTQGGPANGTSLGIYYIYERAFKSSEFGYASAMASWYALVLIVLTGVAFKLTKGGRFDLGDR